MAEEKPYEEKPDEEKPELSLEPDLDKPIFETPPAEEVKPKAEIAEPETQVQCTQGLGVVSDIRVRRATGAVENSCFNSFLLCSGMQAYHWRCPPSVGVFHAILNRTFRQAISSARRARSETA